VGGSPVGTTGSVGATEVLPGTKAVGSAGVGITPQPNTTISTVTTNKIRGLDFIHLTSLNYITQNEACKKGLQTKARLEADETLQPCPNQQAIRLTS
jgi:hypothetical protein